MKESGAASGPRQPVPALAHQRGPTQSSTVEGPRASLKVRHPSPDSPSKDGRRSGRSVRRATVKFGAAGDPPGARPTLRAPNWLGIYARDQRSARLITWRGREVEGTSPFSRG